MNDKMFDVWIGKCLININCKMKLILHLLKSILHQRNRDIYREIYRGKIILTVYIMKTYVKGGCIKNESYRYV